MSSLNTDVLIQRYFDQKNILINHQLDTYNYYVFLTCGWETLT